MIMVILGKKRQDIGWEYYHWRRDDKHKKVEEKVEKGKEREDN